MLDTVTTSPWKPGDPIVIADHRSIHHGKPARLRERHVGKIAGRAWWSLDLETGAIASEFEDSLVGAPTAAVADAANHHPGEC